MLMSKFIKGDSQNQQWQKVCNTNQLANSKCHQIETVSKLTYCEMGLSGKSNKSMKLKSS